MERKGRLTDGRIKRHKRIRTKISGTAARPRLCVFRSLKHMYAQLIDDEHGRTLVGMSTLSPEVKAAVGYGGNVKAAKALGTYLAQKAMEQHITEVVFDRGGYKYHGRVAALAEAAREQGMTF